jgi:hypothetical protein
MVIPSRDATNGVLMLREFMDLGLDMPKPIVAIVQSADDKKFRSFVQSFAIGSGHVCCQYLDVCRCRASSELLDVLSRVDTLWSHLVHITVENQPHKLEFGAEFRTTRTTKSDKSNAREIQQTNARPEYPDGEG